MHRDRIIQMIAVLLAIGSLVGASAIVPVVNQQRRHLGIASETEFQDGTAPKHVLLAAALGSFRGLAVDYLWYRTEKLKQEGKFYDAKALADWITLLQPRFPQVWVNRAWNLAFNISVETHTPQERWDWVTKGIRLLRDEGIVHNPNAVALYRHLGWIYFFKIGRFNDDMHWHYKYWLAEEWEQLLGAPIEGATHLEALESFRPIVDAAENYIAISRPSGALREEIGRLAQEHPSVGIELRELEYLKLDEFEMRLDDLQADLRKDRWEAMAQRLELLGALADEQRQRAKQDPLTLLYEDTPEAAPVVERLRELDLELDQETLRTIGTIQMVLRYTDSQFDDQGLAGMEVGREKRLLELILDPDQTSGLEAVLTLLRAKVLIEDYHMDPAIMFDLMEFFGPLDWRHAASHGAYWSYVGVRKSGELRDSTKYDVLNTDRQVIHAMQQLFSFGRIVFDPINRELDMLPDPRFAPAYDRAMQSAIELARTTTWQGGNRDTFESGHENFLIRAAVNTYLYGDENEAQKYLGKARRLYGHKRDNIETGRYQLPLDDFVISDFQPDWSEPRHIRSFIDAMLTRAFLRGLRNRKSSVYDRFSRLARHAYETFQAGRGARAVPSAGRGPMALTNTWQATLVDSYVGFMKNQRYDLLIRRRVYVNSPVSLQQAGFNRFRAVVYRQASVRGMDPKAAFPPPAGLEGRPDQQLDRLEPLPGTIEIQ